MTQAGTGAARAVTTFLVFYISSIIEISAASSAR